MMAQPTTVMLPKIEVQERATVVYGGAAGGYAAPLRFSINEHRFEFNGSVAEVYALRRDLEDAQKCLDAARWLRAAKP